jgi:hypothetical protein
MAQSEGKAMVCRRRHLAPDERMKSMDPDQNWYRQLAALVLLSASRAAVEFITNPGSREDAGKQLKQAFAQIDYDALARALTRQIDTVAASSKDRLADTIDTLRDTSVGAVEQASTKAQKAAGKKKGGRKMRFLFGLIIGGVIAYFLMDEQRRDELLDKMTGASGPIQQPTQSFSPPPPAAQPSGNSSDSETASKPKPEKKEAK